jgi:hypothetical protein
MHFGLMVNLFSRISRLHPIDQAAVLIEKAANGNFFFDKTSFLFHTVCFYLQGRSLTILSL